MFNVTEVASHLGFPLTLFHRTDIDCFKPATEAFVVAFHR